MKNLLTLSLALTLLGCCTSCFENIDRTFDEMALVEFNDPVTRSPAVGVNYPLIAVTRTAGLQRLRINLVGKQLREPQELKVGVDTAVARLLNRNNIRAVEGTHYRIDGPTVVLKADTSFVEYRLTVLNTQARRDTSAIVVLRLDGNDRIKPSENYRRIGFRINLQ